MSDRFLIFVPAYNCENQVPRVIADLACLTDEPGKFAIALIENRSTDSTLRRAEASLDACPLPDKLLIQNDENYNLGGSHKVAFDFARAEGYEYVIVLHGDDQGSIRDILPLLRKGGHRNLDALLGARFMKGSTLQGYSMLRTWANVTFNLIFSAVAGKRFYDLGSGLNLFRRSIFDNGFHLKFADNLTFNYYLVFGLADTGKRLAFFPINWREDDQISNAKLFTQGITMLKMLGQRIRSKQAFLRAEHRITPRSSYPATVVRRWSPSEDPA
ncbi:glycosyltransferase [Novosphingobium sp. Gsoil 351]|nr:glycosyltransferase family 2 protein [Novosphingobium sp. Gsoil 351]QGN56543.1 glycosyltransferase [Novosphingobium sp. Gsoil 351]